jgi:2-polyprenyl-3-methyl-5-hydroxy-6-metoxy-1,4-benzoquinol methylase
METVVEAARPRQPAEDVPARAARIAKRFARFRAPDNAAFFDALTAHFAGLADHPCLEMYFEYAITSVDRGRSAAKRLSARPEVARGVGSLRRRRRVLDVGCAFGGFLVAFGERGAKVTGIDVNEALLRLAMIQLRERGIDAELVKGDATAEYPEFGARFDLITANDVVEHVPRLEGFLRNLRNWLSRRGVCYLEIPNGAFSPFVLKDGHHQIFGITLLGFPEASAYYERLNPVSAGYDTYNYKRLEEYRSLFASCGLSLTVLPETLEGVSEEGILRQVAELEAGAEAGLAGAPEEFRSLLSQRIQAHVARVKAASRRTAEDRRRFLLDYGASFWAVLAARAA